MLRLLPLIALLCAASLLLSGCGVVSAQANRAANLLAAPLRAMQTSSAAAADASAPARA